MHGKRQGHQWNDLARATGSAARTVAQAGPTAGEIRDLQPAARRAISELPGWRADAAETAADVAGWCHRPGGIDLVAHDGNGGRWIGELKLRKTDEVLWDFLKVADLLRQDDVAGGFLLIGAKHIERGKQERCREIVDGTISSVSMLEIFEANREAWTLVLEGGTARPTEIPQRASAARRASADIDLDGEPSELVLVSVEPDWSDRITFAADWWLGDWPIGVIPSKRYVQWRLRQCEFLRALDGEGSMSGDSAKNLARSSGLNLEKDTALNHRCQRLVTPGPNRAVTDAGRALVAQREGKLRDYLKA